MVMFGKTISLFLIEGDPNKRWVCELSNWNGKAYKIPRIDVKRCSDRKDLASCGVIFCLAGVTPMKKELFISAKQKMYTSG